MKSLQMLVSLIETSIKEKTIDKMYDDFLAEALKMGLSSYTLNVLISKEKEWIKNGCTVSNDDSSIPFMYRSDIITPEPKVEYIYKEQKNNTSNKNTTYTIITTIIFVLFICILGGKLLQTKKELNRAINWRYEYQNKYEKANSEKKSLSSEISSLKQERDNAKSELSNLKSKVSNTYPFIIKDIEIANVTYDGDIHTNYGNSLYGSSTMYLQPRIKYIGLCSGNKTIKVKWYNPDGTIRRGTSSPYGFSQSQSMYVYSGDNTYTLSGWGYSSKGLWESGTYRIEIWYENTCLKSKTFTIY